MYLLCIKYNSKYNNLKLFINKNKKGIIVNISLLYKLLTLKRKVIFLKKNLDYY